MRENPIRGKINYRQIPTRKNAIDRSKIHATMIPKTWTFNLRYTGSPDTHEKYTRSYSIETTQKTRH